MPGLNDAVAPSDFRDRITNFTVDNTTIAKILVEQCAPAVASGALPPYYGGCSIIDLIASSTDAAEKVLNLAFGEVLTTQDGTLTGTMASTATTNGTITRATSSPASFITEGWKVGDTAMIFAPDSAAPNASVDGKLGVLTGVAAGTLTMDGTSWAALNPLVAGTRILRIAKWMQVAIPANAGNSATTPTKNVSLLGHAADASPLRTEKKLGANAVLIGWLNANASAKPATISVMAKIARY